MASVLASFDATVLSAGVNVFSGAIDVEEDRADALDAPISFNASLAFSSVLAQAITPPTRWVGSSIMFDGLEIVLGRLPAVSFDEALTPGQQATMAFSPVGEVWDVPSTDVSPPSPTVGPAPDVEPPAPSPRSWGNKPTSLTILLGKSPAHMKAFRLFQGQSLQKENKGLVAVTGEITSVDDSILVVDKALCYELPPFAGMRRGAIIRDVISVNGLMTTINGAPAPLEVICPLGEVVTKPVLLTNASLMTFLNDFIAPENWFASFDEYGRLFIREIELKDTPDWTLDEALGDFDYDSFDETMPTKPPTRYYMSVAEPVAGTGPDGTPLVVSKVTTEEIYEFYNPKTWLIASFDGYLGLDASGTLYPEERMLLVSRIVTQVTTTDGVETSRVVLEYGYYNPAAFDPNFSFDPTHTDYLDAYPDKSFHEFPVEPFILKSEETTNRTIDKNGTLLGEMAVTRGWYAPHVRAGYWDALRAKVRNLQLVAPNAFVFHDGSSRTLPEEKFMVTQTDEKEYAYAADGTLKTVLETVFGWFSPAARCDVYKIVTIPDSGPTVETTIPADPLPAQPPEPPPPEAPFHPRLTGPYVWYSGSIGVAGGFDLDVTGQPVGITSFFGDVFDSNGYAVPAFGVDPRSAKITCPMSKTTQDPDPITHIMKLHVGPQLEFKGSATPGAIFYLAVYIIIDGVYYYANNISFDSQTLFSFGYPVR
jgi:hypothetical protein